MQVNDTQLEQSEKDMIGSLLDDEEDEMLTPSTSQQKLSKRNSTYASDTMIEPTTIRQRQTSYPEPSLSSMGGMIDFPSGSIQQPGYLQQSIVARAHSMSQEDVGNLPIASMYYSAYLTTASPPSPLIVDKKPRKSDPEDIVMQCKDQYASLTVQQQFEHGNDHQKQKIFKSIECEIPALAKHRFGNYVIQKIIEKGTHDMRSSVIAKLQGSWLELTFDKFGCRVVQRSLDHIQSKPVQYGPMLQSLQPKTLALIFDQCGNHVLQKVMDTLPKDKTVFIIKVVEDNVTHYFKPQAENVVSHSYGCRIAQKCLETYSSEQLRNLYQILLPLVDQLTFCQYGNYIVQHMIQSGPRETMQVVSKLFYGRLPEICRDKFASNVAQKFILRASLLDVERILCLIKMNPPSSLLIQLVNDQYGNYVIQHLFQRSSEAQKDGVIEQIDSLDENLFNSYGKHFIQFMHRKFK